MKLRIKMKKLTPLKRRLLQADMIHTNLLLMDELEQTLSRLKSDRGIQAKIVGLLSKVSALPQLSIESFRLRLESVKASDVDILDYVILDTEDQTILELEVKDEYFQLMSSGIKNLPLIGRQLGMLAEGKSGFKRRVRRSVKDSYAKEFEVEEL